MFLGSSKSRVEAVGVVKIYRKDGSVEEMKLEDISVEKFPWYRRINRWLSFIQTQGKVIQ